MIFKQISKSKLDDKDFLWRYIDLHKLIDLATKRELHFTRIDKFPDPFEGVTYNLIAQRHYAQMSNITNPAIDKSIREQHNSNNKRILADVEVDSLLKQKTQFINCWIMSQRESMAMWNVYSNRDSVSIKIRAKDVIDYFKTNLRIQPLYYPEYEFICGSIKYLRLNPFDRLYNEKKSLPKYSSFKKDVAYDFEKEFRFLIATPNPTADSNPEFFRYKISKDFIGLIEIICHPEMESWKFENMKGLCKSLNLPEPIKSKTEIRI